LPTVGDTPIPQRLLGYADRLGARDARRIDLAVIHCTELPDLQTARAYGERIHYAATGTGNAGHFYVDRDGTTEQWVPVSRVAHHVRGWNDRSVGIELVNRGRYPDWLHSQRQDMTEPYAEAQLEALLALLRTLRERLPGLRHIAGHEDLDRETVPASDDPGRRVRRKLDPGPLFPWQRVLAASGLQRLRPGEDGRAGWV
jgi:N-acetylmuramoyl-L-alanine amidase